VPGKNVYPWGVDKARLEAFLGANELAMGGEDGTFPGVTIRNVWLSDRQRPTSLGSAIRDR
jgi:hypothetical protein